MKYEFNYYKDEDFYTIEDLILKSYKWENPIWSISRHEFCKGLHPSFTGNYKAWEHTIGVYRENEAIVACVINEGTYQGEAFFLFDSKERAQDKELLREMISYAKTHNSSPEDDGKKRAVQLFCPQWNKVLQTQLEEHGFILQDWKETLYIKPFRKNKYEVKLPEGYKIVDGKETPDFYLSNTHRFSFGYGGDNYACEHGLQAFHELRKMKHYNPYLDLCILDPQNRPVAMAIIWLNKSLDYCELEPLGVVWWERRKGLGTAILNEATNRVLELYPDCKGMTGGNQDFYPNIGYEKVSEDLVYKWEISVHPSWDKESFTERYADKI
jgi:predicted N-acetyltransferase YhbS